jgi:hypothetical protein
MLPSTYPHIEIIRTLLFGDVHEARPSVPVSLVRRVCQKGWIEVSPDKTSLLSGLAFQPSFASIW